MDAFSIVSVPVEVASEGESVFYPAPANWQQATMTCTLDPALGQEEISWSQILGVSKPFVALALGWGVGVASGALGLVWLLR